jgi:pantothenate kinase type III
MSFIRVGCWKHGKATQFYRNTKIETRTKMTDETSKLIGNILNNTKHSSEAMEDIQILVSVIEDLDNELDTAYELLIEAGVIDQLPEEIDLDETNYA